jgi:hypothetical protein
MGRKRKRREDEREWNNKQTRETKTHRQEFRGAVENLDLAGPNLSVRKPLFAQCGVLDCQQLLAREDEKGEGEREESRKRG